MIKKFDLKKLVYENINLFMFSLWKYFFHSNLKIQKLRDNNSL